MAKRLLEGVKVLDFTMALVGAFCSRILADMGADIIKVERPPGGDDVRYIQPVAPELGGMFIFANSGKRSIGLDLKRREGVEIAKALVPEVDVVLENFRPQVMRKFGMDYPNLKKLNPGMVMCSLSGYGQYGPWSDLTCTDPIAQAVGGLTYITGDPEGYPQAVGGGLGDTITAVMGAMAVGYALFYRERTGVGQYIDVSMMESNLFIDGTVAPLVAATRGKQQPRRNAQHNTVTCPMGNFKASEGYIAIHGDWGSLCEVMGRRELIDDPRLATHDARLENIQLLQEAVESWLQSFPSDDAAMEALREGQIWSGPVMSQWQILNHPQIQARGIVREVEYPDGTTIPTIASPYQFSETPVQVGRVPFAGEHNQEILEEYLGYSEERVQSLVKEGVMFEGEQARELKSGDR
ncbi:MAG: CoA transferase [Deltaproteobacteria bacterium]|nr:CoA transferase [Deltaproteobacteria bacterium]